MSLSKEAMPLTYHVIKFRNRDDPSVGLPRVRSQVGHLVSGGWIQGGRARVWRLRPFVLARCSDGGLASPRVGAWVQRL